MREIKFRAWDIQNERMVYEPYRFEKAWENELALLDAPYYFYEDWQDVDDGIRRACQIMQYTGLKDKNGKEIYDSDRVKRRVHLVGGNDYIDYNCEVRWIGWSYALYIADKHCWPLDAITAKEVEVIGNIYEG